MSNNFEKKFPIKVKIQISEPWDFDARNGKNYFGGTLLRKIIGEDNQDYYIVKVTKPFKWKERLIDYITITTHFVGDKMLDICKEEDVDVGIGYVIDKSVLNSDSFLFTQVDYFAIGSVSVLKEKKG